MIELFIFLLFEIVFYNLIHFKFPKTIFKTPLAISLPENLWPKNILILFSGTKSFEKLLQNSPKYNVVSLDIDPKFKPTIVADITKWDYKSFFKSFNPDYIHASPVCKEFSNMKNGRERNLDLGYGLLDKCIVIIQYGLKMNPKMTFTIENPYNHFFLNHPFIKKNHNNITTYCKYGFHYRKRTVFSSNVKLDLEPECSKKSRCKLVQFGSTHVVNLGYYPKKNQMKQSEYFKLLKQENPKYEGYSETELRYRIPSSLCKAILEKVL